MRETTIQAIDTTMRSTQATVRIGSRANSPNDVWANRIEASISDFVIQ